MPHRLLKQTWLIWKVSPFAIPMTKESIMEMESKLTDFLRQESNFNSQMDIDGSFITKDDISLPPNKHIYFEVWLKDEPVAQLLLAYIQPAQDFGSILGCAFCLLRGPNKALDPLLTWLEASYGCVFANAAFVPTLRQMQHALPLFVKSSDAPLEVTFQPPLMISGIDKLSMTIPPLALRRLVDEIEKNKPAYEVERELPILKALYCFMKEAFKMNLQSFSLVRIKSAIGVVGIDGKCKFLDMGTLETLLNLILKMIESLALPALAASPQFIPSIDVDDSNQPIESIEI
jgi:Kinetochore complex Sim4 subunit Fta1